MKTRCILLCCGIMMLSACATTEVVKTWKDDSQTQKFSKIFVFAVVKEPAYRRLVEHKLVAILQQAGAEAHVTYDLFPDADLIDKATAAAALKDNAVDGVMVVRLVNTKKETVYTPGTTFIRGGYDGRYGGGWHGYYGGGYRIMRTPSYSTEYNISTVESTIFHASTNKRIWSTITKTTETSVDSAIDSYIKAIDQPLKSSGLF